MSAKLETSNLEVRLGGRAVVNTVSLRLGEGAIGCLLGPSGCGKTTLLRAIAGFERPGAGEVRIDGACVSNAASMTPVERRGVGMVFQDFALFPHLTTRDNIGFGLHQAPPRERRARVDELVRLLEITEFQDHYPHQLSGGQQQRAAIARAMAPRPGLLLLDEPFSNLDADLGEQVARRIRAVLRQDGATALLVTHNQREAFAMADEVGVMHDGALLQWDAPFNLYHRPTCARVADFVGEGVLLPGAALDRRAVETELGAVTGAGEHGFAAGEPVAVLLRPDDVIHDDDSRQTAVVADKAFRGAEFLYTLALPSGARILSLVPSRHDHAVNEAIGIRLEIDHLVVFPATANHRLGRRPPP